MKMQRLDKFLSEAGVASRKELKTMVRNGAVTVNGATAKTPEMKIDETADVIVCNGSRVEGMHPVTVLLNKPAGYVTSTDEPGERTVMELLPERLRRLKVMPVGRLDKETEGLLLFTNDGNLAHRLISPSREVPKVYYAEHDGAAGPEDVAAFSAGIVLKDGTVCKPAVLEPLGAGKSRVTLTEGKYHQVRRMMASRNMTVRYLRREREGTLSLEGVAAGQLRELTAEEIAALYAV